MKFHDIKQNSDEWFDLRCGKVTSSMVGAVMANYGKAFGEPAKGYAMKKAIERLTNKSFDGDSYTNKHMERGHELEPEARRVYEIEEFTKVSNGGFFDNGNTGDSPDGVVFGGGCLEIKCPSYEAHFKVLKSGSYDKKYHWQIHFHIWHTGADWCDFVSYCPEFPEGCRYFKFRVIKDDEQLNMMKERINEFEELVNKNKDILESNI